MTTLNRDVVPDGRIAPPTQIVLVTPSDVTEYDPPLRCISIGTAGDLAVQGFDDDAAVTIPENCLAVGVQHVMEVKKVMSTNTTATEIVGYR